MLLSSLSSFIAPVLALQTSSFTNPWSADALAWEIEHSPVSRLYVLKDGADAPAAFCACWLIVDELHINSLAVAPERRRQGIASELMRGVLALKNAKELTDVFLGGDGKLTRYQAQVIYQGKPGTLVFGEYTVLDRMRKGKKVVVHGDGTSLWTLTHHRDFAKAFASAEVQLDETYTTPDQAHAMMEPHASIAEWKGDELTLYTSTQAVFGTRRAYDFIHQVIAEEPHPSRHVGSPVPRPALRR
mgnify:CR=1 FL=1